MELIRGAHNIKASHKGVVLTIGNFDGVHLGHQRIISLLKKKADELDAPTCVMLFEPQPREKLVTGQAPGRVYSLRDKVNILATLGIDYVLCQRFSESFRQLSALAFIHDILVEKLAIRHLMVGDDFRFGCDRSGDFNLLTHASKKYHFSLNSTETVSMENGRISSTLVRKTLQEADFKKAAIFLGRAYRIEGRIIRGDGLGRKLGTPTANFQLKRGALPVHGVFVARIHGLDKPYMAVVNAGYRPTIDGKKPVLEAHIPGYTGNIYGKKLSLEFIQKIRDEKKFKDLNALKKAIHEDIVIARSVIMMK